MYVATGQPAENAVQREKDHLWMDTSLKFKNNQGAAESNVSNSPTADNCASGKKFLESAGSFSDIARLRKRDPSPFWTHPKVP